VTAKLPRRLASNPGLLLAPKDFSPDMLHPLARGDYDWRPERSESGPITIVVSSADRALYVYRNGNPIGRAAVEIFGRGGLGERIYSLLEGTTDRESLLVPGRAARRWMNVTTDSEREMDADKIAARLRFNPELATKLYDTITPGTTVVLTDHAVVRDASRSKAIFEN
jgi:hypothetical protein